MTQSRYADHSSLRGLVEQGLSSFVNWPISVLVFAVFFCLIFRRQIGALIGRVSKVSKAGFETLPPQREDRLTAPDANPETIPAAVRDPVLDEAEATARRLMPGATVDHLYRALAGAGVVVSFEKLYNNIYGSQLTVLQLLNQAGEVGLGSENLRPVFDQATEQYPEIFREDTFDRWLSFLEGVEVVRQEEDRAFITPRGRAFLVYVVQTGYLLAKRG